MSIDNPLAGKLGQCKICGSYRPPISALFTSTGNHIFCQDAQDVKTLRAEVERLNTKLEVVEGAWITADKHRTELTAENARMRAALTQLSDFRAHRILNIHEAEQVARDGLESDVNRQG